MKRLPLLLAFLFLLSFLTATQGSLQTSSQVKSSGTIAYSTQSLKIKQFTINCDASSFDTTPQIYAGWYDMSETGWSTLCKDFFAQVKAMKSDFKALVYANLRTADDIYPGRQELYAQNGWLLKDQYGNYIQDDVGLLTDIGNSAYQSYIANYLKSEVDRLGYAGVFADDSGPYFGAGELFWGISVTPINPRTGRAWTDAEAIQAMINLHNALKNALGSKLLCCNGIYSGPRFYDHQSAYQQILSGAQLDGFMSEGALYQAGGQWMTEAQWLEAVNFLIWVQDNFLAGHSNRFFVPVAKLAHGDQSHTPLPSGCTLKQMATYAYASMLLGVKTATATQIYFSTFLSTSDLQAIGMKLLYDTPIGTPTSNYYKISGTGVYARDFGNGKVLVNPTAQSYSVSLGQSYVTLDGQTVSILNIGPHIGVILKSDT